MKNSSRRNFGKQLAGALAALPVAGLVGAAQTKRPRKPRKRPRPEGSPITVGGGGGIGPKRRTLSAGVSCEFNHLHYIESGGILGNKKFKHTGWQMRTLLVRLPEGIVDLSDLLATSVDVKCDIKINCSGFGNDLKLTGKDLGIEFNPNKFPPTANNPNRHEKADTHIEKLEINARPIFYLEREFNPGDPWWVYVDFIRREG